MDTQIQTPVEGVEPAPPADGQYGYQLDVLVTPDVAEGLLALNADNQRPSKETAILRYARDMRKTGVDGKSLWVPHTGESIKINKNGRVVDGQNRLHAVIRSSTPTVFDIAWNVDNEAIYAIDGGSVRTTKDDLQFHGITDKVVVGPIVKWVVGWEKGNLMNSGGRLSPTRREILARYLVEPQSFDTSAMYGRACRSKIQMNATASGLAYFMFAKLDEETAEKFFDQLIGGMDMNGTSPVYALRQSMIAKARQYTKIQQLYFMVRAWNALRRGEQGTGTGRLMLPKSQIANENFPMPV